MNTNKQSDEEEMLLLTKLQAQTVEIDCLQKKIRLQEHQYKQQISELTNELQREQKRTDQLQEQIRQQINQSSNGDLQEFAQQLEEKLTLAENAIMEYRQNEHKLQKEIQNIKRKQDNEDVEEQKQQIQDLKQQLQKMEESAIMIIVEKEKQIQDLKDQITDQQLVENHEQQYLDEEKDNQIHQLKELIQEMNIKMEQDQLQFDERILKMEHEITERIINSLSHQISESKNMEQDLLQQINLQEEKIRHLDKLLLDQDRWIDQMKEEHKKESINYENRIHDMQRRLSAALQQVLKSDRKSEEAFKSLNLLQREKQHSANSRDELLKQNVIHENSIRRLKQEQEEYKKCICELQSTIDEQEKQLNGADDKIRQIILQYEQTITQLKQSMSIQHDTQNSIQEELQGQGGNLLSELLNSQKEQEIEVQPPDTPKSQSTSVHFFPSSSRRKRTGDIDKEIEAMKEEIANQKHIIENLYTELDSHEQTIEVLQKEIKQQLLEMQNVRRNILDNTLVKEIKQENETLKQQLHKMETHALSHKQSAAEDIYFLKDELKRAEKDCQNTKILYTQVMAEKEFFQNKLRKLEKKIQSKPKTPVSGKAPLSPIAEEDSQANKSKSFFSYFKQHLN